MNETEGIIINFLVLTIIFALTSIIPTPSIELQIDYLQTKRIMIYDKITTNPVFKLK